MAEKSTPMNKQIDLLSKRIAKLERSIDDANAAVVTSNNGPSHPSCDSKRDAIRGCCTLPVVPERTLGPGISSQREDLIRYIEKKWVNGTKLKYYLFDNGPFAGVASNMELVRQAFDVWKDVGIGIEFEEVERIDEAQVRIGFERGAGSWSYVGRDVVDIPGSRERTMNFGWDLTLDPRGGGLDTPVHEIGHTLSFPHAHQNPFSGITWDEDAVYDSFSRPPNSWSRQQTFHNILRKLSATEVEGSAWDPDSIMHYGFGAGLIQEPARFRDGLNPADGLSETDVEQVRKFYPPLDQRKYRKLKPFEIEDLDLQPAEQANFILEPSSNGMYEIQTFGQSDVVMVLFEEVDGELEFIAGDDDSGTDLNAKISVRLFQSRKYVLRIRMYLNWSSGKSAVMFWS